MEWVEGVELKVDAVGAEAGFDPAVGFAIGEDVGDRREVDEVDSTTLGLCPVVGVAVDEGFDVVSAVEKFEEGVGVLDTAPGSAFGGRFELRVVVGHDDGGFVGAGVKFFGEPVELGFAESAGDDVDFCERVEQEPVRMW